MSSETKSGYLLLKSLKELDSFSVQRLRTRRYRTNYLMNNEANTSTWSDFCDKSPSLLRGQIPDADLDFSVISKSVTWSDRDVNIFVGTDLRPIQSVFDFSEVEFTHVFKFHQEITEWTSKQLTGTP